jgi:hypothetical protein
LFFIFPEQDKMETWIYTLIIIRYHEIENKIFCMQKFVKDSSKILMHIDFQDCSKILLLINKNKNIYNNIKIIKNI